MISKDFFMALDELEATKGIKKEVFIEAARDGSCHSL